MTVAENMHETRILGLIELAVDRIAFESERLRQVEERLALIDGGSGSNEARTEAYAAANRRRLEAGKRELKIKPPAEKDVING